MKNELNELKSVAGELEAELGQTGLDEYEDAADGEATEADDRQPEGEATDASDDGQAGLDAFAGEDVAETGGEDAGDEAEPGGTVAKASSDDEDTIEIVADQRELDSTIARDLSTREGIETRLETLAVGDYVLSDRVVVERKTVSDFMDTLTGGDRSMFEQVGDATRNYARPVVVIEGEDLYGARNVHRNAIDGALASLAVDFGASVLRTGSESETADLLSVIAGREQDEGDREVSVHGEKQAKTLAEQQEYVVSAVAEVGPVTARSLLAELGSVEGVMTATESELQEAEGVGAVTAERIREVVGATYDG